MRKALALKQNLVEHHYLSMCREVILKICKLITISQLDLSQ